MEQNVCGVCNDAYLVDAVACDRCGRQFHLECVNEDETVFNREWNCPFCVPGTPPIARQGFGSTIDAPTVYFAQPVATGNAVEAGEEQGARARAIVATSSPNQETGTHTQANATTNANHTLDEISRCFQRLVDGYGSTRDQNRQENNIVQRLENVLESFVQRMEECNGTHRRASSGRQASSMAFDDYHDLSRSQVSARQAVSKKLPTFDGNPDQWGNFESAYEETTRLCGYSDGENTIRLQQALKGKALRAVQCRLRRPEHLKSALATLRKMFGRPEIVINTLLEQIRRQTPPRADKLDSIVDFAISVEEACATVESGGVNNRFDGPLLQELVGHLPPSLQMQWGLHCINEAVPVASLKEFSIWMEKIKDAILLVTPRISNAGERRGQSKSVNFHASDPVTKPNQQRCLCNISCSQIIDCEGYWQKSVADRWRFVKEKTICKSCLRRHPGDCRQSRSCGKDNCTVKHHPSLHRPTQSEKREVSEGEKGIANLSHSTAAGTDVLLRYVPVTLHSGNRRVDTLALLDEGSTVTLMEHGLLRELGLRGAAKPLCLNWTGGQQRNENNSVTVNIRVSGVGIGPRTYELKTVRTVRDLGLPVQQIDVTEMAARYKHLSALPAASFGPTAPRLLIGMDNYHLTRPLKTIEGYTDEPVATKTRIGWAISGRYHLPGQRSSATTVSFHQLRLCECNDIEARIDAALKDNFQIEKIAGQVKILRSKVDERAMKILENSTTYETAEELRQCANVHTPTEPLLDYERFGRWDRLRRAVGYVWRFTQNLRSERKDRKRGPLTNDEIERAEIIIFKDVQRREYGAECREMQRKRTHPGETLNLSRSSPLLKRSAYLDEDGVLRVNGRIDACRFVGNETKKSIILPKTGIITELIVEDYHRRYRHANHQTVMNEVRQRFDIPALRAVCHRARNRCQHCRIRQAKPCEPLMGNLPEARLPPFTRPFTFTGIDYFGPFMIVSGRKTEKRWGVLFTCLTVRAIHIEVAHSLTTSSCIMAIRNFIARRGTPNEIISDRGTNFIGAERELREALKTVDQEELIEEMNLTNTRWTYNPPASPHFGGAWERLVQSVKRGLYHVQLTRKPTDSVFNNWLMEVEAIINSRPLTKVPVDKDEEAPITPNHFLVGTSSGVKPLSVYDDSGEALRNTWKTSQAYANEFWRRWIRTYLPTLTKRSKWFQRQEPLQVGDIVIIVDENLPRSCWPKGRVVSAEPSKDGAVRRARVQTTSGKIIERPAVKLVRIDLAPQKSDCNSNTGGSVTNNLGGDC